MAAYQTHQTSWQGIPLSVSFCPERFTSYRELYGTALCHLTVESARQPLPLTETRFQSLWVRADVIGEWGGPVAYVLGLLDLAAQSPDWQVRQEAARQLSLF